MPLDECADTDYAGNDEEKVADRADCDDDPDMLTGDTLAQDEGVLRTDRDDQGEAGHEATEDGGKDCGVHWGRR